MINTASISIVDALRIYWYNVNIADNGLVLSNNKSLPEIILVKNLAALLHYRVTVG